MIGSLYPIALFASQRAPCQISPGRPRSASAPRLRPAFSDGSTSLSQERPLSPKLFGPPKFFAMTDLMVSVVVPSGKLTTAPFGAFTVMVT